MSARGARLAIDIGGTFTDVVFGNEVGVISTLKVPTTPEDITVGILAGLEKVGATPASLDAFVHGTTIALNALLERKTPEVGLITTAGFRDVLEIMRTNRSNMYDLQQEKPVPLVSRQWRREIGARMDYRGRSVADVDADEVRAIARDFVAAGISTVAVCLLHAYANAAHEEAVAAVLRVESPGVDVSLSADVSRVWREFERTSTTVSNAATKPIVSTYLERLESSLSERGFAGQVLIMQSNGGVMSAADARRRPVATLMSGPVGGVTGATELARSGDERRSFVTLDIGGTSADVAIIDRGEPVTRSVGHIGAWPVMVPMIDIESIGAGGGSIAGVDEFGGLTVGPESAGARPGPACYGHGGSEATVTDANLVLGRINPSYFLGGELELDVAAARAAIERSVAQPYGMSCEEAAQGIVTVINSNMTRLLWEVMIGRGYDPRDFSLLAFGGAGPLHACELAAALGIRDVAVPGEPGVFSAFGILMADARHDYERMLVGAGLELQSGDLEAAFVELEERGRAQIEAEHAGYDEIEAIRAAELRYAGQDHPLSVELPARGDSADSLSVAQERFHGKHDRLYGFRRDDTPVELVRIQVSVIGRIARPPLQERNGTHHAGVETKGARQLYLSGEFRECPIYDRGQFPAGAALVGPAVVEEPGSTTFVPPDFELVVPGDGTMQIACPVPGGEREQG